VPALFPDHRRIAGRTRPAPAAALAHELDLRLEARQKSSVTLDDPQPAAYCIADR